MTARFSDRLSIRGVWSSSVAYKRGDIVTLSGQTWLALAGSTNSSPVEGSTWTLSAAKGDAGTAGSNGAAGSTGVVSVNAPITNAGTSTAANLSLSTNVASGVPTLDGSGLIQSSQLPALAITDTSVVASEAAMLALSAQVGDVAVRSDLSKSYILKATPASTLANWQELLSPPNAVLSVAGRTGAISLTNADVSGLGTASTKDVPASGDAAETEVVFGTDSRLTDARNPLAHASSHYPGAGDQILPIDIDAPGLNTANTYSSRQSVYLTDSTQRGIIVRGASGATGNLQEWRNSADNALTTIDPDGRLVLGSSPTFPYRAITGARTLDSTDYTVDCTSGTFSVTLPAASGATGRIYNIKNSGTGTITIARTSTNTIDGATSQTLSGRYQTITVQSTGSNWVII